MTLLNWIFIGLLVIDTALIVVSIIKKIDLMQKICSALFFPIALVHIPLLLVDYLPDSFHSILFSILALSAIAVSFCLYIFFANKIAALIIFSLGNALWCELFRTIFYIYRMPSWAIIFILCFYIAIIIACHIITGHKSTSEYLIITITLFFASMLNFIGLFNLICVPCAKSILLFAGSFLNLLLVILNFIDEKKFNIKQGMLIRTIALSASQFLISLCNLMLFL